MVLGLGLSVGGGGGTWEDIFTGEIIMREDNFHEGGQDFIAII